LSYAIDLETPLKLLRNGSKITGIKNNRYIEWKDGTKTEL